MSSTHELAKSIFLNALEISPEIRHEFLDAQCGSNELLRGEVEELLRHEQSLEGFLDEPKIDTQATIPCGPVELEGSGAVIGSYKLLQQIGEGGMGVVYMAEQWEPVERRVALKIIKPGMDTRQVIARFEAERQALAMMDHPNIARVFDAGTTSAGRPYFVMELVKGTPITTYCDEHQLTPRKRLELFVPVCQAIQHAHQKGIIHRDIKPSNVLVAHYDDRPVTKIIDFGVAKAIDHRLTEKTMFTEYGQVLGTIEYMSPEQARFNQWDVDTRSDVYSLGVLLYELLSGETPFDRQRLRSAAFDELLRIIREEDPPRPSTRLSSSQSLPTIAANRKTEPKKLGELIHGELDWIVMKTLEKDRTRRYATANGLARDVERYLNDEPVEACPPTPAYRIRKFVRRNKAAIAMMIFVLATLLVGIATSLWQARRATKQRAIAETNALKAQTEAEKATTVVALLKDMLLTADPGDTSLEELMNRFSPDLPSRLRNQPEVEIELQHILGSAYRTLCIYDKAEKHLSRALTLEREVRGEDQLESARLLQELALSRWQANHDYDTTDLLGQSIAIYRAHHDLRGEIIARKEMIVPLTYQGRHKEAKQHAVELLQFMNRHGLAEPIMRLDLLVHLSQIARALGENEAADAYADEALQMVELQRELYQLAEWHLHLHLGEMLMQLGDFDKAADCFRRGLELAREVATEEDHRVRSHKFYLMEILKDRQDDASRAELEELEASFAPHQLARTLRYRALFHFRCYRDIPRSLEWARRAIEIEPKGRFVNQIAWWAATHPNSPFQKSGEAVRYARLAIVAEPEVGNYWNTLGVSHYRIGDMEGTVEAMKKSMELRDGGDAFDWFFLAMAHAKLGHEEEARLWYDQSIQWQEENRPHDSQLQQFQSEAAEQLGVEEVARVDSNTND